jgi:hypothetical protein
MVDGVKCGVVEREGNFDMTADPKADGKTLAKIFIGMMIELGDACESMEAGAGSLRVLHAYREMMVHAGISFRAYGMKSGDIEPIYREAFDRAMGVCDQADAIMDTAKSAVKQ